MNKSKPVLAALFILLFGMSYAEEAAYALDPPHAPPHIVNCEECHSSRGITAVPWFVQPILEDGSLGDNLCLCCHNITSSAVGSSAYKDIMTHSSFATSTKYGSWTISCESCHHSHIQPQVRYYPNEGAIESGIVSAVTNTSLTDSTPGKFAGKDYTNYILVPNVSSPAFHYQISGNTENTIFIKGSIRGGSTAPGKTYAIKYGKMIDVVVGWGGTRLVKFFGNSGPNSFADGDGVIDGICQVCHTRTASFTSYGTLEGPGHPGGTAGTNCMTCHPHSAGFKAVSR